MKQQSKNPFVKSLFVAVAITTATLVPTPFYAANSQGLFVTGGVQQYISPHDPIEKSSVGLRIGAGYELPLNGREGGGDTPSSSLSLGIEAGLTQNSITGDSRPADSASIYPIALKAGYAYLIDRSLSFRFDALAGRLPASVGGADSPFVGARLSAEYVLNTYENGLPFASVYAGAGADLIIENDRNIALPQVEVALRFRFGGSDETAPIVEEKETIAPIVIVKEDTDSSAQMQPQNDMEFSGCFLPIPTSQPPSYSAVIYFDPETADPIGDHEQALENIGAILTNDTSQTALIRGYAAPVGSSEERVELSQKRAQFAEDYLTNSLAIGGDRLIVRGLSDCKPDTIDTKDPPLDKRRITKIIILKIEKE
ncbi:hypothetical protein FACS189487_06000 [Campylobacterota bacterium]|nr:hypothetical protein FACS189487_06000 [Campylobacterota bacterium]